KDYSAWNRLRGFCATYSKSRLPSSAFLLLGDDQRTVVQCVVTNVVIPHHHSNLRCLRYGRPKVSRPDKRGDSVWSNSRGPDVQACRAIHKSDVCIADVARISISCVRELRGQCDRDGCTVRGAGDPGVS